MSKTIWLNLDVDKVDVTYLDKRFAANGYNFIKQSIPKENDEMIIEMANKADVVISCMETWDAYKLAAVKDNMKFIMRYGAGTDNVDIPAATQNGIYVANIPGANSPAVAEIALLHILNLGRRFTQVVAGCKNKIWPSTIVGNELDGKTVGLVGCGFIGNNLVRMLAGFNVKILIYDPFINKDNLKMDVELVDAKEELFLRSDIISLHVPYNDSTKNMMNKEVFKMMKPTAYLVNTCRGGVVNEADLVEALKTGEIQGAGLDVMCVEPPNLDNPLFDLNNVFITSHMGAESIESAQRSQIIIADTIDAYFEGRIETNVKNRDEIDNK